MSISNASILSGATVTPSGGTALPFESLGIDDSTNVIVASADTDLRTRRSIVCSVKMPKVSTGAPNGYTQARAATVIKIPRELDNGNISVDTLRIELATDVETTEAEIEEHCRLGAQVLVDSDFANLFKKKSLA